MAASFTIYHTSDLHNHLTQAAAEMLRRMKDESPNTLLLDAGDAIRAGNLGCTPGGERILRVMSSAGYDAMAMGNRESHPTMRVLKSKLSDATFPVLAANMMAKRQPLPGRIRSHLVRKLRNGLRVGIIGLAPQMTAPESWWSKVTDYVWDDPVKAAAGLARKLEPETDVIVCLSHLGLEQDERLAEIAEVRLILGGHSHAIVWPPRRVGNAFIGHSGYGGKYVARWDVSVEDDRVEADGELIKLP